MIDVGLLLLTLTAQTFEQRGFVENQSVLYFQTAPNDSSHIVNDTLFRWEPSYQPTPWLKFSSGFDARFDTHNEASRDLTFSADDRTIQRPPLALRRFSATIHKGKFTVELGRQFIRWGKADILNPNDRFAPKDYLSTVVDSDFLGVVAARGTYESGANTLELVWQPWFTPSRTPLLNQRWTALPQSLQGLPIIDGGARYPGGSQYGARFNHMGSGYEYALVFFDGFNNLPTFTGTATTSSSGPAVLVQRTYPRLRLYGGDAAVPLEWFTLKAEASYFTSPDKNNDEFVLYVVQLERQMREWSFAGGYAGEQVTKSINPYEFSPERGFARSFVGHAGFTIDANRNVLVETAIRSKGSFMRFEYGQAFGQHWRATAGTAWLRGDMSDFLGQYNHNSYIILKLRYSF